MNYVISDLALDLGLWKLEQEYERPTVPIMSEIHSTKRRRDVARRDPVPSLVSLSSKSQSFRPKDKVKAHLARRKMRRITL